MYKVHLFETKTSHDAAYNRESGQYIEPWVSYTREDESVDYNLPPDFAIQCLTFKALESGTFQNTSACSYSITNGRTWVSLAANTNTPIINAGDEIMFKSTNGHGTFSSTCFYEAMGNPYSMIVGDNLPVHTWFNGALKYMFSGSTKLVSAENMIMPTGQGDEMCLGTFKGCTSLITPPKTLPCTIAPASGYSSMFEGCTSLRTSPVILATSVRSYCFFKMFYGCTSLETPPSLPYMSLYPYCYKSMFAGCTSLTTAPQLPATTLQTNCYENMFSGCTSLTTAPELPARTLTTACYDWMFYGCSALTTPPELPALILAEKCYHGMFAKCTSLTTAPDLSATTLALSAYTEMFSGCSSLNYIKAMFTTEPTTAYTKNWVSGVAASGTFVKNSVAEWNVTGANGIPAGWTISTDTLSYSTRVEYLENTGSAYIDTGIVQNANTGIAIKAYANSTSDSYIVGLRDNTGNTRWGVGHSEGFYYCYGSWGGRYGEIGSPVNQIIAETNYLNSKNWVVKNFNTEGTISTTALPSLGFTPTNQIRLFGSSGVNAFYSTWKGKLYWVKISQGNDVIMDLVPVRVGSVGCMYDNISGNIFFPTGGEFSYGNDIS